MTQLQECGWAVEVVSTESEVELSANLVLFDVMVTEQLAQVIVGLKIARFVDAADVVAVAVVGVVVVVDSVVVA